MLFCYEVIIVDSGLVLALECVGDGIVSGFESTNLNQDEKRSGIKDSEEEAASVWRGYACIYDRSCGRW